MRYDKRGLSVIFSIATRLNGQVDRYSCLLRRIIAFLSLSFFYFGLQQPTSADRDSIAKKIK